MKSYHAVVQKPLPPLLFATLVFFSSSAGIADESVAPPTNEACLECHGSDDEVDEEYVVDAEKLARGPHNPENDVSCVSCHTDAATVEDVDDHGELAPATCSGECHEAGENVAKGAHGWKPRHDRSQPTCKDCHGTAHEILYVENPSSPAHHENQIKTCGQCHGGETIESFKRDVHATLSDEKRNKGATCSNCHGGESHNIPPADLLHNAEFKRKLAQQCGGCHEKTWKDYRASIHGVALFEDHKGGGASCADCHGSHGILRPDDPKSLTHPSKVDQVCAECHANTRMIRRFNLKSNAVASYRESFHGRANRLSDKAQAANCSSCHTYHAIFPADDPRSSVHPSNLRESCGNCHPGASDNFLLGKIHVTEGGDDNRWSQLIRAIYLWLIALSCLGMVLHNSFDFFRKMRLRKKRRAAQAAVERMTREQRIGHFFFLTSFIALAYTGFALILPDAWWVWPVRIISEAESFRSLLHRIAACIMVVVSLHHMIVMLFTKRGHHELKFLWPRWRDVLDLRDNLLFFLGKRTQRPSFEHYGYVEKFEYWALAWGTIVMVGTGIILWFEDAALQWMPLWLYDVFAVVHRYEAILAVAAIILWHMYHVLINPDEAPMSTVWLDGQVTVEELKHTHPAEYERLKQEGKLPEG